MSKIIIHLSDLHVTNHLNEDGKAANVNSWLTTAPDETQNKNFIDEFVNYINNAFKDDDKYLLISGDLADRSDESEYQYLIKILNRIQAGLEISIDKILIIPGDHDINRIELAYRYQHSDKEKPSYELNEEKYTFFSRFYQEYFKKDFKSNEIISDFLVFEDEKLLIIGMNSNGRIGTKGGDGYIDNDKLNSELSLLLQQYPEFSKVGLFHHNIYGQYENNIDGQWDATNKIEILKTLEHHSFEVVMFGNEHTSASNSINQLVYISVGSFSKTGGLAGFKVYKIINEEDTLELHHYRYALVNDNAHNNFPFGSWSVTEKNNKNENIDVIVLRRPASKNKIETIDLIASEITENNPSQIEKNSETEFLQHNFIDNPYHFKLFKIVKELDLFKSGHFHWSDSSKAHNWIDIPMLLSEREHVHLAQKAIFDTVEKNKLEFDFVLGLGIEGNIIASYTALKADMPYSYLPYSYRYKDHEEYEKKIKVQNNGEYRKILIITDVIDSGKTVDQLLEKEADFFSSNYVENIWVVTLFYTGELGNPILKFNSNGRVNHFFVSHMKVEACPYGKDFRHTCMIYREKLACVHEFYDAKLDA